MIRVRFVTSDDLVSFAIRAAEYGFWATHVEAVVPSGALLGAHFVGGVQERPDGYDAGTRTREQVVEITLDAGAEVQFYAFLHEQLGKPYDVRAIGAFMARRDWQEPDSWFCSELIAAALVACGYLHNLATEVNHVTPRDLLLILSGIAGCAR